jgi:hypothetical protein
MRVRLAAVFKEVFGMTTEQNESQTTSDKLELGQAVRVTSADTALAGVEGKVLALKDRGVEIAPVVWPFKEQRPESVWVREECVQPLTIDAEFERETSQRAPTEPPRPRELELERARELIAARPEDAVRMAYDRGYREGVQEQRGQQARERAVNELAADARQRERVRLRGGHPFSAPMLGTVVDVGRKGAVVDWDSGLRNYVEFAALEPLDEPDPIVGLVSGLDR